MVLTQSNNTQIHVNTPTSHLFIFTYSYFTLSEWMDGWMDPLVLPSQTYLLTNYFPFRFIVRGWWADPGSNENTNFELLTYTHNSLSSFIFQCLNEK